MRTINWTIFKFLANAPVNNYVTLGNVISIVVAELAAFITVIGIMMLWIGNQLNSASKRREEIASENVKRFLKSPLKTLDFIWKMQKCILIVKNKLTICLF